MEHNLQALLTASLPHLPQPDRTDTHSGNPVWEVGLGDLATEAIGGEKIAVFSPFQGDYIEFSRDEAVELAAMFLAAASAQS